MPAGGAPGRDVFRTKYLVASFALPVGRFTKPSLTSRRHSRDLRFCDVPVPLGRGQAAA